MVAYTGVGSVQKDDVPGLAQDGTKLGPSGVRVAKGL